MYIFGARVRQIRGAALLVGFGLTFALVATVFAHANAQSTQLVEITDIEIRDAKTDDIESVFPKGAKVRIEVQFTDLRNLTAYDDDDPDFDQDYVVVFEVKDDDGKVIYSTDEALDGNDDLRLEPEERKSITFNWNAPFDADTGRHKIVITVRNAENYSNIQDEVTRTIIVQNSAASLFVSESSIDFGDVEDDDTPRARIIVANPNRAAGDLIWRVVDLPDWLELITPDASETDPRESVLVTNNSTIIVQVRSTVLKGTFDDRLKIESNGGTSRIDVSVSVDRNANGLLTQLKTRNSLFDPGDDVVFLYRVKNDGAVPMTYRITFLVRSPTGSLFYNSNATAQDATLGPLDPGDESDSMEFTWTIPFGTLPGDYELGAELRAFPAFEYLFDNVPYPADAGKSGPPARSEEVDEGDTFEVKKGALIAVAPPDWAFGPIKEGDTDTASFAVSNNGRGTLEWTVVSWPEWLKLESPTETVSGRDIIEVAISESARPGNVSGTIDIESTGGLKSIKVSARILPLPTATVGIATVLARLLPTATPEPTATPLPSPSVTPTPAPIEPAILSGRITVRNGGTIPADARLVARIGDYTSPPGVLDEDSYSSLVVIPPDRSYIGQSIEIYLGDTPATMPSPLYFFQGGPIRIDLAFSTLPTATPVARPEPSPTASRAVENPLAAASLQPASPTATATAKASEPTETATPQIFITAVTGETPGADTSGGCGAPAGHVSWATGLANVALLLTPIGLLAGVRINRRRQRTR